MDTQLNTQAEQTGEPIERTRTCFLELIGSLEPLELVGLARLLQIPIHTTTNSPHVAATPTLRGRYDLMYDIGLAFLNMKRIQRKRLMEFLRDAVSTTVKRQNLANYRFREIPKNLWS